MEEKIEMLLAQNKLLSDSISDLAKLVIELKRENEEMKDQLHLNTLISKTSCPIYSEVERQEAMKEIIEIKESEKRKSENLNVNLFK